MGAGGSVSMPKEMPSDAQIQEAAKTMPPEAIDIMKKIIAAAEKSSEKSPAEKPAEAGKLTRPAIKKIGNSDAEGVDMERAIFMWDEEKSKECLKEILEGAMPEVVNGAMLVMEEVVWPDSRDAKNWPEFLRQVAGKFLDDQVNADEPFMPPENAREHCLYLMNPTQADAYLEKLGLKKVGKTGKQLMQDDERNEALGMDDGDKVYESFPDTAVLFIKDLVKKAA